MTTCLVKSFQLGVLAIMSRLLTFWHKFCLASNGRSCSDTMWDVGFRLGRVTVRGPILVSLSCNMTITNENF